MGPWSTDEAVVALDAKTGATIWEHRYPARTGYEDFSFGPGPHATPLVVGDRVFTVGPTSNCLPSTSAPAR
jgi:outer membrane protein assembly factor BamB